MKVINVVRSILYEKDGTIIKTMCPFRPYTKVGSMGCQDCSDFVSRNTKNMIVECNHPEEDRKQESTNIFDPKIVDRAVLPDIAFRIATARALDFEACAPDVLKLQDQAFKYLQSLFKENDDEKN